MSPLFNLAPSGVYHAFFVTKKPVSSYLTVSPLPWLGGLFSVALSLRSPSPVVNWHCVLMEPGLSSTRLLMATIRLSGRYYLLVLLVKIKIYLDFSAKLPLIIIHSLSITPLTLFGLNLLWKDLITNLSEINDFFKLKYL